MHEATPQILPHRDWTYPTSRRLVVVKTDGDEPSAPDAGEMARLVEAVSLHRDREAFAALFRYYGPRLKTFFMRGSMSAGLAEDLVQETMLAVWRKASYFDAARAGVGTWIFTIARNLRIDHLRRQKNPADLPTEPEEQPPSMEDVVLEAERDLKVRRALEGLSPDQQTVIRLSYYSEKSQTEIAEDLKIPLGTVKSRVRLAMSRLRALLEDAP